MNDMEEKEFEKFEELYRFLRDGKLPEGMQMPKSHIPKMSGKKAFTIIWYLQEHLGVLPDNVEQCQDCQDLFDSDKEGFYLDDQYSLKGKKLPKKYWGHWCDACAPNIDFILD
jgi:hypothetical protein